MTATNKINRLGSPTSTAVGKTQDQWDFLLSGNQQDYPLCYSEDDDDDDDDYVAKEEGSHLIDLGNLNREEMEQRDDGDREGEEKQHSEEEHDEEESLGLQTPPNYVSDLDLNLADTIDMEFNETIQTADNEQGGCDLLPMTLTKSRSFESQFLNSTTCPTEDTDEDGFPMLMDDESSASPSQQEKIKLLQSKVEEMARLMSGIARLDGGASVSSSSGSLGSDDAVVVERRTKEALEQQAALDRLSIAGLRARNTSLSSENAEFRSFVSDMESTLVNAKTKSTDATHKIALEVENVLLRRHLAKLCVRETKLVACPTDESECDGLFDEDEDVFVPDMDHVIDAVRSRMATQLPQSSSAKSVSNLQLQLFMRDQKMTELQQHLRDMESQVRELRAAQPLVMSTLPVESKYPGDAHVDNTKNTLYGQFPKKKIAWNKLLGRSRSGWKMPMLPLPEC
jgi:hypothetical protein